MSGLYGAVACVRNVKNPIHAARAVLDNAPHNFLIGSTADEFAREQGIEMVPNHYFSTTTRRAYWEERRNPAEDLSTVGAVALDLHGHLAAAGSTGGMTGKTKGRLGDTAILGAGIYADENVAVAW